MSYLLYTVCIIANIFSIALISKGGGAFAFIAFFLATVFSGILTFLSIQYIYKKKIKYYSIIKKMLEYLPLVAIAFFVFAGMFSKSSYALDAFFAITWVIMTMLTILLLFLIRNSVMKKKYPQLFKKEIKHKVLFSIIDWIDAIAQTACIVLLFHLFVFQLYLIPSESMVPTFMIGDKVMGIKCNYGPTFPLSSFRFPQIKKYKRGDVVIIRNPNYEKDENNDLKFFVSQLVQLLTLTMVNPNLDDSGKPKVDPLVKRIVACSDEKVMLVDGVLYIKKKGDEEWKVQDESSYAVWNLDTLSPSLLKYVKDNKIGSKVLNMLEDIEEKRKNLDANKALNEAKDIVEKMKEMKANFSASNVPLASSTNMKEIIKKEELSIENIVQNDIEIASKILSEECGIEWFSSFMTDWANEWEAKNEKATLYEKCFANLNVLIKISVGNLLLCNAKPLSENILPMQFSENDEKIKYLNDLKNYYYYLAFSGQRNLNEFPRGEGNYIPKDSFFMMGDNRFNSTDMRHGYKFYKTEVDKNDSFSIRYITNIEPKYIKEERLLGQPTFIFWPHGRIGKVK